MPLNSVDSCLASSVSEASSRSLETTPPKAPLRPEHDAERGGNVLGPVDQRRRGPRSGHGRVPQPARPSPAPRPRAAGCRSISGDVAVALSCLLSDMVRQKHSTPVCAALLRRQAFQKPIQFLFGIGFGHKHILLLAGGQRRQIRGQPHDARCQENHQLVFGLAGGLV